MDRLWRMPDTLRTVPGVANVTLNETGPDKLKPRTIIPYFGKFNSDKQVTSAIMYVSG